MKKYEPLNNFENVFKTFTNITQNLSNFPITKIEQHLIRTENKNNFGEVFSPPALVDKMILKSKPLPDKFNIDLCAGMGNFTIRLLRYFTNNFPNFDIKNYLENYHWINEINPENAKIILNIFENININLLVGPAEKIKYMKCDSNGTFLHGIWYWKKLIGWVKDVNDEGDFGHFFEF